jgi:uncharacterized protein
MLTNLLQKPLSLPSKSEVITQAFLDFLAGKYQLDHNGYHGIEHWLRVLINGRIISAETGADLKVVEYFAVLHDVMRNEENADTQHGNRGANFATQIRYDWVHLDDLQFDQLIEAIKYHSFGRLTRDITVQSCWDADRLDLGRVGLKPNKTYLGTSKARDVKILNEAYERSKKRFVNYDFRLL